MSKMQHEHVMKLKLHYEDDSRIYLVEDLMVSDLRYMIWKLNTPMQERYVKGIIFQILLAVNYCH